MPRFSRPFLKASCAILALTVVHAQRGGNDWMTIGNDVQRSFWLRADGPGNLSFEWLGDWGFGRHTIGSNFFHYIQDPWGSWFEYYSDMDHIADYSLWTPTNYAMEDSLASWGPEVPHDFVHNYEVDEVGFRGLRRAALA